MSDKANFKVDPRLASLLGKTYRSTEHAVKELVDNSWDADAKATGPSTSSVSSRDAKGIGKFAGLMVANVMEIETTARGKMTRVIIAREDLLNASRDLERVDLPLTVVPAPDGASGPRVHHKILHWPCCSNFFVAKHHLHFQF